MTAPSMSMGRKRPSTTGSGAGQTRACGSASSPIWLVSKACPLSCSSTAVASRSTAPLVAQKGGLGSWYRHDQRRTQYQAPRRLRRERPSPRPAPDARKHTRCQGRNAGDQCRAALAIPGCGQGLRQQWLPHTTRAALTGLKKKGHAVTSDKVEGRVRIYRVVAP